MLALLRLIFMLLLILTAIYWSLVLWLRAAERDRLEREWQEVRPPLPLHRFVENGMRDYRGSLRRKLLWGVYVVPLGLIALLIYLVNYA